MSKDYFDYFEKICALFNNIDSYGGVKESLYHKNKTENEPDVLVTILAYCLLPNHFHLLLRQEVDDGISKFMQKVGTGFTMYFNKQQSRSGSLFQGKFKSRHVAIDAYLKNVLVYINRNNEVHSIVSPDKFRRSHELFLEQTKNDVCDPAHGLAYYNSGAYKRSHEQTLSFLKKTREEKNAVEFTEARPT